MLQSFKDWKWREGLIWLLQPDEHTNRKKSRGASRPPIWLLPKFITHWGGNRKWSSMQRKQEIWAFSLLVQAGLIWVRRNCLWASLNRTARTFQGDNGGQRHLQTTSSTIYLYICHNIVNWKTLQWCWLVKFIQYLEQTCYFQFIHLFILVFYGADFAKRKK